MTHGKMPLFRLRGTWEPNPGGIGLLGEAIVLRRALLAFEGGGIRYVCVGRLASAVGANVNLCVKYRTDDCAYRRAAFASLSSCVGSAFSS